MTQVNLEAAGCPLGCAESSDVVLKGSDLLTGAVGEFTVVKCTGCGLMRTDPRPSSEAMAAFYPPTYGPYVGSRVNPVPNVSGKLKGRLKRWIERTFLLNENVLPILRPGTMLEVGCASGAFLEEMTQKGWKVQGIEYSESAAQAAVALGHQVHIGPVETATNAEEQFDLVVAWMVLEHLHQPVDALRNLRNWSKSESYLVLSVPNCGSSEFRLFGRRWYALQLPTHLFHFDVQSLERVLDAGGWRLERIFHQRLLSNFVGSLGYVLRDIGLIRLGERMISFPERPGWVTYAFFPISWILAAFGQTGRMTIWARHK